MDIALDLGTSNTRICIEKDGKVIGAVGVSGGSVPQDVQVAEAAVKAFDENK